MARKFDRSRITCSEHCNELTSAPVCTTRPHAVPEASTVLAHSVFSKPSGSCMQPPSKASS